MRLTIARLEETPLGTASGPLTYTEYLSYVVSSGNPWFDSGGTFATVDAQMGVYTYTFARDGYPATFTHTIGAQIDRPIQAGGPTLHANPIFDFVPPAGRRHGPRAGDDQRSATSATTRSPSTAAAVVRSSSVSSATRQLTGGAGEFG